MLFEEAATGIENVVPEGFSWQSVWDTIVKWATSTGIKVVIALVVLLVSFKIINVIYRRFMKKTAEKCKIDVTVAKALANICKIGLKVIIAICLVAYLGIDVSAITAVAASTGVGIGLAVNGALSNFAGGVLLLITRPFKIGDYISIGGLEGTVDDIRIINTKLITVDKKVIYVANSTASSASIINFSESEIRRMDLTFSIDYGDDFEKARAILLGILDKHEKVLKDPAPMVRMSDHADSSIDITCRGYCLNADYWDVHFDVLEQAKAEFDANGIHIPFPQLDVHLDK